MTTHYVDIRLRSAGIAAPWEALTHDPIPFKDAKGLLEHIGHQWEGRIRMATLVDDVPTMLERLNAIAHVPEVLIAEARAVSGGGNAFALWMNAHQDEILTLLRAGVFGVFEKYRGELGVTRWRPSNNVPKHKRTCKRSSVSAVTTPASVRAEATGWQILTELDARVAHVNAMTLPGLGIAAAMVLERPTFHTATCRSCKAVSQATSIAVEVIWGEHHLRREYEI